MTASINKVTCPACGGGLDKVVDSRPHEFSGVTTVRRRRLCGNCGQRQTTFELTEQQVVKMRQAIARDMAGKLIKAALE